MCVMFLLYHKILCSLLHASAIEKDKDSLAVSDICCGKRKKRLLTRAQASTKALSSSEGIITRAPEFCIRFAFSWGRKSATEPSFRANALSPSKQL